MLDQIKLSLFCLQEKPVFHKNIKEFAVRKQVLNTFMYFWNTGSFLQTNLTVGI